MKALFLLAGLSLSLNALAGTKDGGGANAARPEALSPYDLQTFAGTRLKPLVTAYINSLGQERYEWAANGSSDGSRGLREVAEVRKALNGLKIEGHKNTPCKDRNGEKKDSSIYNVSRPGNICVSFNRLAKNWNKENFEYRFVALIMHELNHLADVAQGFEPSEARAVFIEETAISSLKTANFEKYFSSWDPYMISAEKPLRKAADDLHTSLVMLGSSSNYQPEERCRLTREAREAARIFYSRAVASRYTMIPTYPIKGAPLDSDLSYLSTDDRSHIDMMVYRLRHLEIALCYNDLKEVYNKSFGENQSLTLEQAMVVLMSEEAKPSESIKSEVLQRISDNNQQAFRSEVEKVEAELQKVGRIIADSMNSTFIVIEQK